jgi:hypothetical protein
LRGSTAIRCWYFVDVRPCSMPASALATASALLGGTDVEASKTERRDIHTARKRSKAAMASDEQRLDSAMIVGDATGLAQV